MFYNHKATQINKMLKETYFLLSRITNSEYFYKTIPTEFGYMATQYV